MAQTDDTLEYSFMWPGISLGDAAKAPYNAAYGEEVMALRMELLSAYDRTVQGIIDTDHADYAGKLALSSPAVNQLRIASGAAIVNGWHYLNLDDRDFTVVNSEQYRIVLRRGIATAPVAQQTVRLALLNTPAGAPPAVTQTTVTWEIELGTVTVDGGGVLAITSTGVWAGMRVNNSNIKAGAVNAASIAADAVGISEMGFTSIEVTNRQGADPTIWCADGSTNYALSDAIVEMQAGSFTMSIPNGVDPTVNTTVTFPQAFAECPIVVVTSAEGVGGAYIVVWIESIVSTTFDIYIQAIGTVVGPVDHRVTWIAIGPKA